MSSLYEKLQQHMRESVANNFKCKNILRLVVSEMSTLEARTNKSVTDEQAIKILKKLVESNNETITYLGIGDTRVVQLNYENSVLHTYIPEELSEPATVSLLNDAKQLIIDSKSEGQAIGCAIKYLKWKEVNFNSGVVSKIVKEFRG